MPRQQLKMPRMFKLGLVEWYTVHCRKPILDLVPKKLHERSPIFLGSREDVEVLTMHSVETCGWSNISAQHILK